MTEGDLGFVAEAAVPLYRRLAALQSDGLCPVRHTDAAQASIETLARLDRWKRMVGEGFETRLAVVGLKPEHAFRAVDAALSVEDAHAAPWLDDLARLCHAQQVAEGTGVIEDALHTDSTDPAPYPELRGTIVDDAVAQLHANLPTDGRALLALHREALAEPLATILTRLLVPTLGARFIQAVSGADRPPHDPEALDRDGDARLYRAQVRRLARTGMRAVWRDYPVLARLLSIACRNWRGATQDLVTSYLQDRPLLETFAGLGTAPLSGLRTGLSDLHRGHRSVAILSFGNGSSVVYKPRSLQNDLWAGVLWDQAARSGMVERKAAPPAVLDRGTYGWAAYVRQRDLPSADAAQQYYRQAGQALLFAHATRTYDVTWDNVIAEGERPRIIDWETFPIPPLKGALDESGQQPAPVSHLSLLPVAMDFGQGHRQLIGGIASAQDGDAAGERLHWHHPRQDTMAATTVAQLTKPRPNMPRFCGDPAPVEGHEDAVLAGFSDAYAVLLGQDTAPELAASCPPPPNAATRLILRPTGLYELLSEQTLDLGHLGHGLDRSIALEWLWRRPTELAFDQSDWAFVTGELEAMEDLDVPIFTALATSTTLCANGQPLIPDFLAGSPHDALHRRLGALNPNDKSAQEAVIRKSLGALGAKADKP